MNMLGRARGLSSFSLERERPDGWLVTVTSLQAVEALREGQPQERIRGD